jgi:cell division protein FtsW
VQIDSSEKLTYPADSEPLLVEPIILGIVICLVLFSLVMVYSVTGMITSSPDGDPFHYVKRQTCAILIGAVLAFFAYRTPMEDLRKWSWAAYPAIIILLLAVFIPGVGVRAGGAVRWINLGIIRFQPGELVKLLMVFVLASYFSRHERSVGCFIGGIAKPIAYLLPVIALFYLQRDFGSSVVMFCIALCMATVAGAKIKHFLWGGLAFSAVVFVPMIIFAPYRVRRLVSYLDPMSHAKDDAFQLVQSLIALGTGGMLGQGLGRSQQKLHYLPAAHTDFIFSVIGEELGFIGCVIIVLAFLLLLIRVLYIAHRFADDVFKCTLVVGLGFLLVLPALLNMGVVTGLLPTKGMVLPLIGYGGSSMMVSLLAVGILLNLFKSAQLQSLGGKL